MEKLSKNFRKIERNQDWKGKHLKSTRKPSTSGLYQIDTGRAASQCHLDDIKKRSVMEICSGEDLVEY